MKVKIKKIFGDNKDKSKRRKQKENKYNGRIVYIKEDNYIEDNCKDDMGKKSVHNKEEKLSGPKHKRKGANVGYKESEYKTVNIDIKKYFDNFFRNKNKLPKAYYFLLLCMLVLGVVSVTVTFKAYNLFAKEDYELYAKNESYDKEAISTMSTVQSVENDNKENNIQTDTKIENTSNIVEAKVSDEELNNQSTSSKKNNEKKQNIPVVKPLTFIKPIDGNIQKPYSPDKVVYSKTLELWKTHDGIDITADAGKSVKSIEKGTVEKVYEDSFYGITVVIDHGQGYKSCYSNLEKSVSVKEKQVVNKGQVIGKIGSTSIGEIKDESHLHFTLFKNNENVDPTYIFK